MGAPRTVADSNAFARGTRPSRYEVVRQWLTGGNRSTAFFCAFWIRILPTGLRFLPKHLPVTTHSVRRLETLLASYERTHQFREKPLIESGGRDDHAVEDSTGAQCRHDVQVQDSATVRATWISGEPIAARLDGIAPGSRIAHYRVDARLGAGGMGEVFRAWDLALDRAAAVKVIRPGFDPSFTQRLLREVDACAHLQHPAIATFFEGGEDGGWYVLRNGVG